MIPKFEQSRFKINYFKSLQSSAFFTLKNSQGNGSSLVPKCQVMISISLSNQANRTGLFLTARSEGTWNLLYTQKPFPTTVWKLSSEAFGWLKLWSVWKYSLAFWAAWGIHSKKNNNQLLKPFMLNLDASLFGL